MGEHFQYDVFLSYSSKDKQVVRELAQRLKADGLRVWFDEWEIKPGDTISLKIEQGLEQSRTLVLCMSANAFAADWVTLERHTALFRDPTSQDRRFIPLRLDDAPIGVSLKQFACVDWRDRSEDQYLRMLAACRARYDREPQVSGARVEERGALLSLGHIDPVYAAAVAGVGNLVVSGSLDMTIHVCSLSPGEWIGTLKGHTRRVLAVAVSRDGRVAISGSSDTTLRVWDLPQMVHRATLEGHSDTVSCVAMARDGGMAVSGSDDRTVRVWDLSRCVCLGTLEGHTGRVSCVAVTEDGRLALSGSHDNTVRVWDLSLGRCVAILDGHRAGVHSVAVTGGGAHALAGSGDNTVRVWDLSSGRCLATLEGHTDVVSAVAVSRDGQTGFSGSWDMTIRMWDVLNGECLGILKRHTGRVLTVAVTEGGQVVSASASGVVRVWGDIDTLCMETRRGQSSARYTNAKVLLVGETGVGKTALSIRLTEDRFEPATSSTDAVEARRPTWATQLRLCRGRGDANVEHEIWLWDFAGQADYRLIHQLYMDETALAVLIFNPQSEDPFDGLGQWDRDIQRAARRPFKKLLVAGRCDRGGLMVSKDSIERFYAERGFAEYIETSARQGTGCDTLRDAIIRHIPWEQIPWTASPRVFKLLKEEIIKFKDEGVVLLRMAELKQRLELQLPDESFSIDQMRAVVGLLAGPGIIWQLEFGEFVLLQPERINSYAGAVIRSVRAHTEEIGCIAEEDVLAGKLDYQDVKRLPRDEEEIVLRAMHQTLVDHGLCLREHTEHGTLLIFPSYFKRERPRIDAHPVVLVTYRFSGALDEIYATLIVRLHHTSAFERDRLWRFAADYKTPAGKRLGLKMSKKGEGAGELEVYFDPGVSDDVQVTFIRYIHEHLKVRAQDVVRLRHYVCQHCGASIDNRNAIEARLAEGLRDIVCVACERRVMLWDLIEEKFASEEFQGRVRELEERAKASIDNESRELILVGHMYAIAGEAGQIYRQYTNSDHGIDGEVEFKDYEGKASGKRLYIQLKSGDSYLRKRKEDDAEIFTLKKPRWADYWQRQAYPVMLVIRTSDGTIRWMDVSEYLKRETDEGGKPVKHIVFDGEPLTASNLFRMRDTVLRATTPKGFNVDSRE